MADEQEWSGYANQNHLKATDTLLGRTSSGAGVEIPGEHVVARRLDDDYYNATNAFILAGDTIAVGGATVLQGNYSGSHRLLTIGSLRSSGGSFFGFGCMPSKDVNFEIVSSASNSSFGRSAIVASGAQIEFFCGPGQSTAIGDPVNMPLTAKVTRFAIEPGADNTFSIGNGSSRWSAIYAGTGTINTSDERHKTWRGTLSENEYAAALQIIDELGFYQWNDSIAEKSPEEARYHFGVRAQQAFDILDEHLGVDAWRSYAFACHDSWDAELDENEVVIKEAGDRYGLREGQFTLFLLAAQARRQNELEQRIEALEA